MRSLQSLFTAPERRVLWRALLALLLAVITWLALSPAPPESANTGWDKANHTLAFAALAFVSVWALWQRPRQWLLLVAALLAYGGFIEIAQSFVPSRSAEWNDVLADGMGIALGLLAASPIARLSK
ncbi:VanZ family protein [Roseateles sp. LYH14W]|uniref:VanZ family protein n=1 Tax=Pelomonas parva TaxID=3299032 RepID=A0ABW7EYS2_9BURK